MAMAVAEIQAFENMEVSKEAFREARGKGKTPLEP